MAIKHRFPVRALAAPAKGPAELSPMRNCATLLTSLTYYFVFLVIVLEMADAETPKAYCGLAGLGLTQAVPL